MISLQKMPLCNDMTCVAKDGENLYIHLFLEEAFYNE